MTTAPPSRGWSMRGRLLGLVGGLVVTLLGGGATAFYLDARAAGQQLFDNSMRETASLILQLAEYEIAEHGLALGVQLLTSETRPGAFAFRYQIWTEDMRSAYRSESLPASPLMSLKAEGFDWVDVGGETWRGYARWNATHTLQIQIVESPRHRQALADETFGHLLTATLLLLLLAAVALAFILARTVQPVGRAARSVATRSPDDLAPIDDPDMPREVAPLLASLNQLFARVRDRLAAERRFTADASHELRTPLAAIRTNAQVLVGARDEAERARTASDLLASVDRSSHLVEQLLTLARADARPRAGSTGLTPTRLDDIARAQLREQSSAAARRNITLGLDAAAVEVLADAGLLAILLRNLLDNAIRYTPEGGLVQVTVALQDGQPLLAVTDSGPGIPPEARQQVFERFVRLPGSGATGSGLGLSIVARIAELHGAQVLVSAGEEGRGTRIELRFPAPT